VTKTQHKVIAALSVIVCILAFMLSARLYFRLDLTRTRAYTLSPQSRNLYRELDDTLRITYFVSDRLVSTHPLPEEISGFLKEYAAHSRGRIQFIQRDPVTMNLVREVEELGILPQTIRIMENNEIRTVAVYSGVLLEYLDRVEVLPLVFSLDSLEYDISSRIITLARDRDRILGIIIGESSTQWDVDYALLDNELRRRGYILRLIVPGEEIPDALPVLFVLGGVEELDEWALYRIDRYIQTGGRVLFALDSLSVNLLEGLELRMSLDQGLLAMAASYGAVVLPAMVLDRACLQISFQARNNASEITTVPYPQWINVQEQNGNPLHPVTLGFQGLHLYWASPLELYPAPGVNAEAFFYSSPEAWLPTHDLSANPENSSLLELEMPETRGTKILGAALSGQFPSFFQGALKPERETSSEELPDMPAVTQPSRIIVIGNALFAASMMEVGSGEAKNLNFLLRAADWLGNDEETIVIRQSRPGRLDRIADLARRRQVMALSQVCNVFVLPLLVVIAGFIITRKRKRQTKGKGNEE
jgi:ABC-type uncharacterized transport system involved in gliding motility auxiliary subunit